MRGFVASMFRHKPPAPYLDRLTEASLRTPEEAAKLLLAYPVPRTFWREAVYSTRKPVLYAVRPTFAGQAGNFAANAANGQVAIFEKAGHALFVDEPERFNRTVEDFLGRKVWPGLVPAAAAAPPPMVSAPPVKAKPSSASDAGRPAR